MGLCHQVINYNLLRSISGHAVFFSGPLYRLNCLTVAIAENPIFLRIDFWKCLFVMSCYEFCVCYFDIVNFFFLKVLKVFFKIKDFCNLKLSLF